MIGATVAGAAVAAEENANVPDRDFFIDPADGMNNSLIVVGSDAAAADVVSAAYVSSQVGQMAYYEETTKNFETVYAAYEVEEEPDNYLLNGDGNEDFNDYVDIGSAANSWVVLPYECGGSPQWDYDVYFDTWSSMDDGNNFLVDTGCSYESISVDFSIRDVECSADMCIGCMAGCDQLGNEGTEMLDDCQTYPNVYARNYWGTPSGPEDVCDPVGGIQYRSIVNGFDSEATEVNPTYITWNGIVGPASEAYGVCEENPPQEVDLYCSPCDVYFLGNHYDALSFGTDEDGYDYMYYGTPEWYEEEKVKVGETSQEYGEGWTITVNDLGIYENKAHVTITNPDGEAFDYLTVIDTYTSQVPSSGEGDSQDGGVGEDDGYANEENDCLIFKEDTFNVYSLCGAEEEGTMNLDGEAVFAVDFTKTMIGAAGTYVIEYDAYALKDYGVLREQIYPGACETDIDPAIKVGELEWFFDIIPGDVVQTSAPDLDNDPELWETGNPNYDSSDKLNIYAPVALSDLYAEFEITDDPSDSSFSSMDAFEQWEAFVGRMANYYQTANVDVNVDGVSGTFSTVEFVTTSPNGEDLVQPLCSPMLELWLATPVELAGLCDEELSITLEDCEGNNYFTLTATDSLHSDYQIDGDIEISRTEMVGETVTTHYVDLAPESLVKLDENITTEMKQEYNLVLIGGPVANTIVQELVDLGKTTFEKWDTSEGDLQHIENAFADGKDVLIVAGKDRDATTTAALDLVNAL
jgi:hypothetical protein